MSEENAGMFKACFVLIMMSAVLVLPANLGLALDIHNITIGVAEYRTDGVSSSAPYEFWAKALGDDITQVRMTTPGGAVYSLEAWDQYNWGLSIEDYTTLASLRAVFPTGNYTFTFNGGTDSVTLDHNPTAPTGFANITYPVHDSNDVPLNPTLTWDDCTGYGSALTIALAGEVEMFADIALTSLAPVVPLEPGRHYAPEVSVFTGSTPSGRQSNNSDAFDYYDLFENCNEVLFTTRNGLVGDFCGANFTDPDGYVDVWDLMQFAEHWHIRTGEDNWGSEFDLAGPSFGDADGYIDVWDLMVFADHWHEGEKP